MPRTGEDEETWREYLRQVRPLPGRIVASAALETASTAAAAPETSIAAATGTSASSSPASGGRAAVAGLAAGIAPAGLDSASWHRLRTGRMPPSRVLDLHGRTVHAAYLALERFLRMAHAEDARCVEVITGRGAHGGGAIRRELPLWLNLPALRPLVLAIAPAPRGNDGATRVLVRRRRG